MPNIKIDPVRRGVEPDAHGQAALLVTESLIHMLVESATLSSAEARQVIETAREVKVQVAEATGESHGRMQASLDLLSVIGESFETDAKGASGERGNGGEASLQRP